MMTIKEVSLLSLQSAYMRQDPMTRALCFALDRQFLKLFEETRMVIINPRIEELGDAVLDELAWGRHVDGYDAMAPVEEKRRLVMSSKQMHKYKGTAFAVEQTLADVFGGRAQLREWFEYDGIPKHFKVEVDCVDKGASADDLRRAERLIMAAKNLRSQLDSLELFLSQIAAVTVRTCSISSEIITVYPGEE